MKLRINISQNKSGSYRPALKLIRTLPVCILVLLLLPLSDIKSQDAHFSQFFETPLLRNPGLAGIFTGDIRVQGVYRDQWQSVTQGYRTGSLNAEYKMPIGKQYDFLTWGFQALFDKAGTVGLTTAHFQPVLNYHKSLSGEDNMYLSLGFMGGIVQKRIDRSKITTNNQYDGNGYNPGLPDGEYFTDFKQTYWDGSVGMSFNSDLGRNMNNRLFLGIAYHHFNRPTNSFYKNPDIGLSPKWVYSAGVKLQINEFSFFNLQADYSQQGPHEAVIGGALYGYKIGEQPDDPQYTIQAGAFLRWKDAFIPVIKLDYKPVAIALSYDINVSPLKTASMGRGGFELSVTFIGFLNRENSSRDAVLCPRF
ncbi:MAG TPA: PorP/SprF family type IX secretion system membrane protein [Parasegetibacter sp.]